MKKWIGIFLFFALLFSSSCVKSKEQRELDKALKKLNEFSKEDEKKAKESDKKAFFYDIEEGVWKSEEWGNNKIEHKETGKDYAQQRDVAVGNNEKYVFFFRPPSINKEKEEKISLQWKISYIGKNKINIERITFKNNNYNEFLIGTWDMLADDWTTDEGNAYNYYLYYIKQNDIHDDLAKLRKVFEGENIKIVFKSSPSITDIPISQELASDYIDMIDTFETLIKK